MVVTGLNGAGRMVGFYAVKIKPPKQSLQSFLHAFVWDDATQTGRDFNADLPSAVSSSSMALCVNAAGTIAGIYWDASAPTIVQRGFLWKRRRTCTIVVTQTMALVSP